jgi:hypothetical protein
MGSAAGRPMPWLRAEGLAVVLLAVAVYTAHGPGWLLFLVLLPGAAPTEEMGG